MPFFHPTAGSETFWVSLLALLIGIAAGGLIARLRTDRASGRPPGLIGIVLATLAGFALIAWQVQSQGLLSRIDVELVQWLQARRTPWLTDGMLRVTTLHNPLPVGLLMLGFGLILLLRGQLRWLLAFVLAAAGGTTLNLTLKHLFVRARFVDDQALLPAFTSYSFPSGHVAAATLLYGFIVLYLSATVERSPLRQLALGASISMIGLVAFSRLYLGAHYLSDVLAAALLAVGWLVLSNVVVQAARPRG